MIYFLTFVFIALLTYIFYLTYNIHVNRVSFDAKLKALEEFVVQLNEEQKKQSNQLQISSELREKMKEINQTLNKNIFEMNYQLFEDNYQKKK